MAWEGLAQATIERGAQAATSSLANRRAGLLNNDAAIYRSEVNRAAAVHGRRMARKASAERAKTTTFTGNSSNISGSVPGGSPIGRRHGSYTSSSSSSSAAAAAAAAAAVGDRYGKPASRVPPRTSVYYGPHAFNGSNVLHDGSIGMAVTGASGGKCSGGDDGGRTASGADEQQLQAAAGVASHQQQQRAENAGVDSSVAAPAANGAVIITGGLHRVKQWGTHQLSGVGASVSRVPVVLVKETQQSKSSQQNGIAAAQEAHTSLLEQRRMSGDLQQQREASASRRGSSAGRSLRETREALSLLSQLERLDIKNRLMTAEHNQQQHHQRRGRADVPGVNLRSSGTAGFLDIADASVVGGSGGGGWIDGTGSAIYAAAEDDDSVGAEPWAHQTFNESADAAGVYASAAGQQRSRQQHRRMYGYNSTKSQQQASSAVAEIAMDGMEADSVGDHHHTAANAGAVGDLSLRRATAGAGAGADVGDDDAADGPEVSYAAQLASAAAAGDAGGSGGGVGSLSYQDLPADGGDADNNKDAGSNGDNAGDESEFQRSLAAADAEVVRSSLTADRVLGSVGRREGGRWAFGFGHSTGSSSSADGVNSQMPVQSVTMPIFGSSAGSNIGAGSGASQHRHHQQNKQRSVNEPGLHASMNPSEAELTQAFEAVLGNDSSISLQYGGGTGPIL